MKSNRSTATDPLPHAAAHIAGAWLGAVVLEGTAVFLAWRVAPAGGYGWWIGAAICHLLSAGALLALGVTKRTPAKAVSTDQYRARLVRLAGHASSRRRPYRQPDSATGL